MPLGPGTSATCDPKTGTVTVTNTGGGNPSASTYASVTPSGGGSVSGSLNGSSGNAHGTITGGYSSPGGFSGVGIFGYSTGGFGFTDTFGTGQSNNLKLFYNYSGSF